MRPVPFLSALLALSASSLAYAQTSSREWPATPAEATRPGSLIGSEGEGAIPALPPHVQTNGQVTYINGGVSDEEEAALKAHAHEFNLHLLISGTGGAYVGDIKLTVLDASGNAVLSINDAGPYVYARLHPGTYTLEAISTDGTARQARIKIPAHGSVKKNLVFPQV